MFKIQKFYVYMTAMVKLYGNNKVLIMGLYSDQGIKGDILPLFGDISG